MNIPWKPLFTARLLFVFSVFTVISLLPATSSAFAQTFTNPAVPYTADPYMVVFNKTYYFISTDNSNVAIRSASSITQLAGATPKTVYTPGNNIAILSPGLWYLPSYNSNQPWYIVYQQGGSGGSGDTAVLQSDSTNPLGTYHVANSAICKYTCGDTGYLQWNGNLYLITSDLASIYLTPMTNPSATNGSRSQIINKRPAPSNYSTDWEWANNDGYGCCIEGPFPWVHNGQLSMSFSGNRYQNNEYATGLAKFNGGDVLNFANWQELDSPSQPTFGGYAGAGNGVWGAAAARGFTAPGDSTQQWMVYAGYQQSCEFCGVSRQSFAQPVSWNSDNTPNFGATLGTAINPPLPAGDPGSGSPDPSNGIVSGKIYRIVNNKSGLTLDCYDQGNGTSCYGWQYYGDPNQKWQIVSLGDGSYKIINQQSLRALDAYNLTNGSAAYIWEYVSGIDQKWEIFRNSDGSYRFMNVKSGNALDVYDTTNGASAYVWQYVSGIDQNWTLDQLN